MDNNQENKQTASSTKDSQHLAAAFAIIGGLIARGALSVDLNDAGWANEFALNVENVAVTLCALEVLEG